MTPEIRPMRTLWLLAIAHAVNHAQAVLLPLVYLRVITELGVGIGAIALLVAVGSMASGLAQLSYASLTRHVSRRVLLGVGGLVFGGGFAAQAVAPSFPAFAAANIASKIGGSPQHPVGNGLLAEQFPPQRYGFAIAAHIAGGNVGTVVVALAGAWLISVLGWRGAVVVFGLPAMIVALALLVLVREEGTDRAAARAAGSLRSAFRAILGERDLRWVYLASVLGGGGRGLGTVNLFVLLYLTRVIGLDDSTSGLMYGALIVFSVPAPLVAGWLSDRIGRRRLIIGVYLGGALSFLAFLLAGPSIAALWAGIVLLGVFAFAESPQLQSLLADIARPEVRDVSFATYFTLAFGVGSLWTAGYGGIVDAAGAATGLPLVFLLMSASYIAAAAAVTRVRAR